MSWASIGSLEDVSMVTMTPLLLVLPIFGGPSRKKCAPNAMSGVEEYGSCDGQTNSLILVWARVKLFVVVAVTLVGSVHQLPFFVVVVPWTFTSSGVQVWLIWL